MASNMRATGKGEISPIAEKYLSQVSGGECGNFTQFAQQSGQSGPHSGPFWEQICQVEVAI